MPSARARRQLPSVHGYGDVVRHDLGQVLPRHARIRASSRLRGSHCGVRQCHPFGRGNDAAGLRALLAQDAGELARVDVRDPDDAVRTQVRRQVALHAEVRRALRHVADDQPRGKHACGFLVVVVDTGVADMRVRQRDDLSGIGRVGQDFLVPGNGRVEHHFAQRFAGGADRAAAKDRSVGQH